MAGVTTSRTKGQCHSSSLLRLIVCMLALQQDECIFFPKSGTMIPNGGRVCTGQNINLTFTPFDPQVLENVRLQIDGTLVSSAPTQIVNTTAIFTVSIMSEKEFPADDNYLYNCCFTSLDCMSLIIYIMPEPVKNFACVAYDDTDTTVCTWELGKEYNWRVKPNLLWRTSGSKEQWKLCPDLGLTSCTWLGTRLPTLELRVDVSCECGINASSLHTLDTKAIRMPEPAISVDATSLNSTCILVTWFVKQTSYAKTHHLFVGSKWNDSQLHRYNDTDMETGFPKSREKIICGLNPDTVYECSVALLPQNGGYFSRNVTTSALTHYTVPGSSPSMVPDGFEWNLASCVSSRYRFVTVYWQPIPKLDQNGEMKAYVLTIEGYGVSRDVQEVASDVTSLRLYLMCDTYYTVHIQARNNAGTSRQRSRIVIPQANAAPAQTNFVVELLPQTTDEISRQVALSLVNKGQGRHTVFYCRKGQLGGCDWKTPVRWVSMETTEATFNITDPLNTMFGVSTSVDNVRSGFSWNYCLYTRGQVPKYKWAENDMSAAVTAVNNGMSVRKAADEFGVPKSTLSDRVTGRVKPGSIWGKTSKLSTGDETALVHAAITRADKGIGFSKGTFLKYVGLFAEQRGVYFKGQKPSDMWWRRLKTRHPTFSLRNPEPTAANRHAAMTRQRIGSYFSALKDVLDENNFNQFPERIWNMDETGIQTAHKPQKVIAAKGTKTVQGRASISRETITVIACGNAIGRSIPPYFIVPGKTSKKLHGFDIESCRDPTSPIHGAKFSVSDSGWTKEGIGQLWFKDHFLPNIGQARPQLLIFDGHGSHNSTEFLRIARAEGIILGELPSHTSNWTQPFDRAVFKSLKNSWNKQVDNFVKHTGASLGHSSFLRVFGKAWADSITPENICSGFMATGIHPFDPTAIPDVAFAPGESDRDLDETFSTKAAADVNPTFSQSSNSIVVSQLETAADVSTDTLENLTEDSSVVQNILTATPLDTETEEAFDLPFVELLVPTNVETVELPYRVSADGILSEVPETETMEEVSDEKALEVIESSLLPETLSKYCAAYLSGVSINDGVYATWFMYKTKCVKSFASPEEIMNKHFPLPYKSQSAKPNRNMKKEYFVITADEVYQQKVNKEEEKKQKAFEKELRRIEREKKKELKLKNVKVKRN